MINKPIAVPDKRHVKNVEPTSIETITDDTALNDNEAVESELVNSDIEGNTNEIEENNNVLEAEILKTPNHAIWNALLNKYVKAGKVDYASFKKDTDLEKYLDLLANNPPESSWSRDEQLAYWINAYNAFTIKLIVDNYPVKSIMDLHNGKPWDVKWINLGSKSYSLNQIENDIIRPQFKEPRIHFAVNCAAKSCPPIANEAFTAANLEQLLEKQTIAFINDTNYNTISSGKVNLSKIFEWYASDFGSLIDFISKYSEKSVSSKASISYMEYDWALNGR
ncbi:MAG: DUF547 domain-containing protein [Saprospiraceae bacterium]|nr:DUF547 domain-containing protein [Saprospiraceae bacterium]